MMLSGRAGAPIARLLTSRLNLSLAARRPHRCSLPRPRHGNVRFYSDAATPVGTRPTSTPRRTPTPAQPVGHDWKLKHVSIESKAINEKGSLRIELDGKQKQRILNVPAFWLRDHCLCPLCRDPDSGQRSFSSTVVPDNPACESAEVSEDGSLRVVWGPGAPHGASSHVSTWSAAEVSRWRAGLSSSAARRDFRDIKPVEWTQKEFAELQPRCRVSFQDWTEGGPAFWQAMHAFQQTGLLFVTGAPHSETAVEDIAAQMGPIQETFYGRTFDVVSKPNAENIAYTSQFLGLHADLMYLPNSPRIQFLHCLANSCDGGESIFADAFRAAEVLRREEPDLFEALLEAQPTFEYHKDGNSYWRQLATIVVDGKQRLERVNWSPPFQGSFQLPIAGSMDEEALLEWKEAARELEAEISAPENMFEYKMKPGECVVFDNLRVMHGRNQFNTATGERWLKGCYVSDFDYREKLHHLNAQRVHSGAEFEVFRIEKKSQTSQGIA
ncbi:Clavaminate synthase-like protein [Thozetella sp. PMI_491]|nr:Clavaminate synthase-like protein [Thozetella sp. PMI_491]